MYAYVQDRRVPPRIPDDYSRCARLIVLRPGNIGTYRRDYRQIDYIRDGRRKIANIRGSPVYNRNIEIEPTGFIIM